MSTGRCSPEPWRECSSMFLTIESARLPCCTTLSRLPCSIVDQLVDLGAALVVERRLSSSSRSSSTSSPDSAEKLLTKLSGFLISCAMPAVSWPSEASFSVWISRSCAVRNSSSERDSSSVRAWTSSKRRDVLDRDHRLVGERLDQFNLLLRERAYGVSLKRHDAYHLLLPQQRHGRRRSKPR